MVKKVLTIAGSDSSGGAGIQADIKTISALGGYALSVICSVTAQNTKGVFDIYDISPENVGAQLDAVFDDIEIDAVKIGMVSNASIAEVIADRLERYAPEIVVCDPVMVSTSGCSLISEDAKSVVINRLFPISTLITPNIPEAEDITKIKIEDDESLENALYKLGDSGCKNVLIKGGHLENEPIDTLLCGEDVYKFSSKRVHTKNTHGTGCTLSSAIAAFMAKGDDVGMAVAKAKDYLTYALEQSFPVGHGHGPVNHFWNMK